MKNVFLAVALLVAGAAFGQSSKPNVKIDNAGNYVALETPAHKDTATGAFYVAKDGTLYPVYRSKSGKIYALRISKKGKTYKYYLKPTTVEFDSFNTVFE